MQLRVPFQISVFFSFINEDNPNTNHRVSLVKFTVIVIFFKLVILVIKWSFGKRGFNELV